MSGSTRKGSWSRVTQAQSTVFGKDEEQFEGSGISPELKMCQSTIRLSLFSVVSYQNKNCKYSFHFKCSQLRLQSMLIFPPL